MDETPFWDELLAEAVGPYIFTLEGREYVVDPPLYEDVAALDTAVSDWDVLDELLDEDVADAVEAAYAEYPVSALQSLTDDLRAHFGILTPPKYGWAALVRDMNAYGPALERDLADIGLDLYDWVRDHENLPWSKLYRLGLDHAAEGGWVEAARLLDEELAREAVEAEAEGEVAPSRRPSIKGWTVDRENGLRTVELLEQVVHATWGSSQKFKGKGGPPPKQHPRPETAYEKVRQYRMYVEHDEIASALLGDRYVKRYGGENDLGE